MTSITLEAVEVSYPLEDHRILHALRGVDLSVGDGEIVAVVGESGCGKSTLGRVALGVLRPTAGRIFIQGHDIWDRAFRWTHALRSVVQIVHQDPFASLNPVRTIFQTLEAPLAVALRHGVPGIGEDLRREAHRLLEQVGLTPPDRFLDKYPFQLSGGQRQRVSIARATLLGPRVIVADEPVSAVDASMRLAILDLMRTLREEKGLSFLYITHDLATARYLARKGRLVVMYLGEIIEEGGIDEVLQDPRHPYLKALLAAIPPMDPRRARENAPLPLLSYDVPSPIDLGAGCSFRPRCPIATEECRSTRPVLKPISATRHRVACHNSWTS